MNFIDTKKIREYIACPQFGQDHYGKWGALTYEQRFTILRLVELVECYEDIIENELKKKEKENSMKEIEELKSVIKMLKDLEKEGACEVHFVDGKSGKEISENKIKELLEKLKKATREDDDEIAKEFVIATLVRNDWNVIKAYEDFIDTTRQAYEMTLKHADVGDDLTHKIMIYTECVVNKNAQFIETMMCYKDCTDEQRLELIDMFFKIREKVKM